MCIDCYRGMDNDRIIEQVTDAINQVELFGLDYFDIFNKTSVNFIFYICMDNDKDKGIKLLKYFYSYLKQKPIKYYIYIGFDEMYHPETIRNIIDWLETLDDNISQVEKYVLLSEQLRINENYYSRYNIYNFYYYIKHNILRLLKKRTQLYLTL